MNDCIFCKIAGGEIPVETVLESDRGLVFPDLHPQSPVHLLVIPRQHHQDLSAASADEALIGHLLGLAASAARDRGLLPGGYRIVTNIGPDAGQSVDHLHFHVLGGRKMRWPPG